MLRTVLPDDTCEGEKLKCLPDLPQDAIEYFATLQGVQIYNASYGPTVPSGVYNLQKWSVTADNSSDESQALKALSKGKIIVAAAGNDRDTNPVAGKNPSGLGLYPFIRPGVNANAGVYDDGGKKFDFSSLLKQPGLIIAVTSVDKNKKIVPYAQTCGVTASWCVAAPGGTSAAGIYSTIPDGYLSMHGTSMAAPMVSGALAVLSGAYPNYDSQDLAHVLFATAENVGGMAADNETYGYGMIRLDRAIDGRKTLAARAEVGVASQNMTYWSQPLTTDGAFNKTGDGYLIIAGKTTAKGDVTVSGGALGVDGTLALAATQ